jgi:peptidyl-prolyl cis-trans isomerase A (cyclophilin A)
MRSFLALSSIIACAAAQDLAAAPFTVEFTVNLSPGRVSTFDVTVHPEWAPLGAARFRELIDDPEFFKGVRFFRTIKGFMTQFGISGTPSVAAAWRDRKILDDPVIGSNKRGYLSFATSGKDSRTTQVLCSVASLKHLVQYSVSQPLSVFPFPRALLDVHQSR